MNSYNENLHSSVVSSLNDQELELKKVKAELDASTFSLYYAEGARITAAEKLNIANKEYTFQQKIQRQAVIDSDVSTNVLTSANNGKDYVATTVTNTSVAAANVQIAANAILKLASDVGSIFSIVNAADFGTEIHQQSLEAYELMADTAYLAEKTSQHSMEASAYTAEVSAPKLADRAGSTDASVKNLLDTVTAQFDAISETVSADNAALAAASTAEKNAEGKLEDINAAYCATMGAYQLSNKELNLNLRVQVESVKDALKDGGDRTYYTVLFDPYKSPFGQRSTLDRKKKDPTYPVDSYYIMLVKDSKKETFAISNAEALVQEEDTKQYVKIKAKDLKKKGEQIFISELEDTDGDAMKLGQNYVIFVLAVLETDYKKTINTFDDYLTAPSAVFNLTNQINAPKPDKINIDIIEDITASEDLEVTIEKGKVEGDSIKISGDITATSTQELKFELTQNEHYKVSYRCLFLPENKDLVEGLLTVEGLRSIERETELLEDIADEYDPKIADLSSDLNSIESELSGLDAQITEVEEELKSPDLTDKQKTKLEAEKKKLEEQRKKLEKQSDKTEKDLKKAEKDKSKALKSLTGDKHIKPGFFFNLLIAERIPAGSYTSVDVTRSDETDGEVTVTGKMILEPETTDNFGNRLIKGNTYIPVVLVVANDSEEENGQFTNALSDFQHTKSFTYTG